VTDGETGPATTLFAHARRHGLRVVGDAHGDLRGFAHAAACSRFVLQLGDLVDDGPDSAGALRLMFELIDAGRGAFVLGNHDWRLARAIAGRTGSPPALETVRQLDPGLKARASREILAAPVWLRAGASVFVHGGFHTDMLEHEPPPMALDRHPYGAVARALFGEPTGRTQPDGYPERSLAWVGRIPAGITVYVGHDRRSTDGRPLAMRNDRGGAAVFLDTGAGKGGHLSWIDLDWTGDAFRAP
jgi:protein phosphatase